MRHRLLVGFALTGLVLLTAAPTADSAPQTSSGFVVVASPTVLYGGYLKGVAAVSVSDVWAIGSHRGGSRLLEHYNGSSWRVVAPPPLPRAQLTAISAHGSAVWIAGNCLVATGPYGCVARYTGSQWVRVAVPRVFSYNHRFNAMLVFSNTNVVVGTGGLEQMIRWNGKAWSGVRGLPQHHAILGLAGTLSTRLFAVASGPLFEREQADGSWLSDPLFPPGTRYLPGPISASSAENVWWLGAPSATRWNGTTQTPIAYSGVPSGFAVNGILTTRPDSTWAIGVQEETPGAPPTPLIEHYTGGASFTYLDSPTTTGQLLAMAPTPGSESDLWAVGDDNGQPLILHHAP